MFTTRLISGIILVLLSIVIVGRGGVLLFGVTALISLIGLFELYRVLGIHKRFLAVVGFATAVSYYGILWWEGQKYVTLMVVASLMILMALYVFTFPEYKTEEITGAFFGVCYVPVMLSYLYQTRVMEDGAYVVWLIFLSSWGCDTCAYCSGMLLGKHKLAPVLSPKKSIEGAVGGRGWGRPSWLYLRFHVRRQHDRHRQAAYGLRHCLCHRCSHIPNWRFGCLGDQAESQF